MAKIKLPVQTSRHAFKDDTPALELQLQKRYGIDTSKTLSSMSYNERDLLSRELDVDRRIDRLTKEMHKFHKTASSVPESNNSIERRLRIIKVLFSQENRHREAGINKPKRFLEVLL